MILVKTNLLLALFFTYIFWGANLFAAEKSQQTNKEVIQKVDDGKSINDAPNLEISENEITNTSFINKFSWDIGFSFAYTKMFNPEISKTENSITIKKEKLKDGAGKNFNVFIQKHLSPLTIAAEATLFAYSNRSLKTDLLPGTGDSVVRETTFVYSSFQMGVRVFPISIINRIHFFTGGFLGISYISPFEIFSDNDSYARSYVYVDSGLYYEYDKDEGNIFFISAAYQHYLEKFEANALYFNAFAKSGNESRYINGSHWQIKIGVLFSYGN